MQACRQFVTIPHGFNDKAVEIIMLWFKILMVYRLSRDITLRAEEMEKQLASMTFTHAVAGYGQNGLGSADGLSQRCVNAHRQWPLLFARAKRKILPSPVIKQALGENPETGSRQGRKLKDGKRFLKDEVLHSLLPRAFSRFSQTMMWIDTVNGLIMVDCVARKKRKMLALLRKSWLFAGRPAGAGKSGGDAHRWVQHRYGRSGFPVAGRSRIESDAGRWRDPREKAGSGQRRDRPFILKQGKVV